MSHVVVACGGQGTRLGYTGQKCLVPIDGRPFLYYKLDELRANGATSYTLLVAHHSETVYSAVRDEWRGLPVYYHHDSGRGPWEAVRDAAPQLPETFWVTWGDTLFDQPLDQPYQPLRFITPELGVERPNVGKQFLDAGLYHVNRDDPCPRWWMEQVRHIPTWTINTPDQLERTRAHIRRHSSTSGDRGMERASVGVGVHDEPDTVQTVGSD